MQRCGGNLARLELVGLVLWTLLLGLCASSAEAQQLYTLHTFWGGYEDGGLPHSISQASDGALYGTTFSGGANNEGVLFKINKDGRGYLMLHDFIEEEGSHPSAALFEGTDGALYGTTTYGGAADSGAVFKVNRDGTGFVTLHEFQGSDGKASTAQLVEGTDGVLYGTTAYGGSHDLGVVFGLNKDGTGFVTLHEFTGGEGQFPTGGLVEGTDGALYGTTWEGGASVLGTVFKLAKDGGGFVVLHDFAGWDGERPAATLVEGADGLLYGTASEGGETDELCWWGGCGTIFRLNKDGSGFLVLHDFGGGEGALPAAKLAEAPDGTLYGTAAYGGADDAYCAWWECGTAFKMNKDGSEFRVLHDFVGRDGENPNDVVMGADGVLYGTTLTGGLQDYGTVFRLVLPCEASIEVGEDIHTPGSHVLARVRIAHHRPKTVTVSWELRLIDADGRVVVQRTTAPHTFEPGDVIDREVGFRLPNELASGTYTLELAISGMSGTKGATTTIRVVQAE